MCGGSYDTVDPSFEYGGAIEGYNYFVSGDYLESHRHRRGHPVIQCDP